MKKTIDYLESWPNDINTFNYGTQWKYRIQLGGSNQ